VQYFSIDIYADGTVVVRSLFREVSWWVQFLLITSSLSCKRELYLMIYTK